MKKESKFDINFAHDESINDRVSGHFVSKIKAIRSNRFPLEEAWWRFFNMWNVTKDGYHNYVGRAQLYIPEVRKNVEAQARQLTKSAFPSEDCFDVSPGLTGSRKGALSWKAFHKWAMDNCHIEEKYFVAMRQMCLLGSSPIYLPWRKETSHEFRSKKVKGKIIADRHEIELFNGPDFIVRDLFRWYAFNPKKSDLSDGCFEIMAVTPFDLLRAHQKGDLACYKDIAEGSADAYQMEEFSRDVMRAESEGIQIQYNTASAGEAVIRSEDDEDEAMLDRTYMRTRIFQDMVFPEACEDDEDPEKPIPMQIDIYGNGKCGSIKRNQFYHQKPPYVVGKYIQPNADEFYGQGIPWATQFMQYEMNTKAEQGMDSATLSLNPIAIIDPGLAGASNEFNIEPGAIWWASPAGVKMSTMPDVTPIANQAIQQLKALMADYSDRSPALPPQLMGKSRSATQSEIVFDSLGVDNWLFQLQNENMILTPMLEQWEAITDQNLTEKMIVMVLGRQAGDLKRTLLARSDLLGRYAYKWKGASATASKQVLARQMLDAVKVLQSLPPGSMQGFSYNEFFKVLWTDIWSLPNAEKLLGIPETMVAQDATYENEMAGMGLEIEVLPMDNDDEHMATHDKGIEEAKSEAVKMVLMQHSLEHKQAKQQKQIQAQQAQAAQAFQQKMQMLQAQALAVKGMPKDNQVQPGQGNRTQLTPNANAGDAASGVRP